MFNPRSVEQYGTCLPLPRLVSSQEASVVVPYLPEGEAKAVLKKLQ